jgi:arylsulfatase A
MTLPEISSVRNWGVATGLLCLAAAARAEPAARPLNVIVLLADDMGWGDLGCQGHPFVHTPGIDRLAATGCRLEQFYVTAPVCSSSRAGLITGRIQNRYGLQHIIRDHGPNPPVYHHVPLEEPMMPRLFKAAGFTTAHIGKWHLSFVGRKGEPTMADYGYDYAMELDAFKRYAEYYDSPWWRNGEPVVTKDRWTDTVYVDEAIAFIEQHRGKPFFINLWSYAPHMEVACSRQYRAMYADRTVSEQFYYGTISQMDAEYARLLDYLDRTGLADSTIVVFSSDNGPPPPLMDITNRARGSTGGLRGSKYCLYEGGIREPGIIRWPGLTRPGSVSREVCWTPDLLATFAAVYGLRLPAELPFDGIDLRPALRGEKLVRAEPLYWQHPFANNVRGGVNAGSPGLALRDGPWKLHCDTRFGHLELYNLDTDRNEQWNMKDVYPEIAGRLLKKMRAMYAEINGPYSKEAHFINPEMPEGSSAVKVE